MKFAFTYANKAYATQIKTAEIVQPTCNFYFHELSKGKDFEHTYIGYRLIFLESTTKPDVLQTSLVTLTSKFEQEYTISRPTYVKAI